MSTHRRTGAAGRGVLWCTAFTLVPYLLAVLALLLWAWPQDTVPAGQCAGLGFGCTMTGRDGALLLVLISAPFAALATGVAWLLVLLLQLTPARQWAGALQGGVAALAILAVGLAALAVRFPSVVA
jgi:hypothetical protein